MDYLKLLELEHRAAQLSLDLARLESSLHYGWVTMGAKENEEGEKKGGSKVFIEGGKITKGHSNLAGRTLKDGKLEKKEKTDSSATTATKTEAKGWKPGSTVSVAGAKYKYIGYDPEQGGYIVENEQGDQWPLEERELQIAKLIEPPSQKRSSGVHLLTQEQFVQSEKSKRVANANTQVQNALSQLEQTLQQQGIRLPVGISARQYAAVEVSERKRPNKRIKEAFRNLEHAERNAEIIRNDKKQEQLDARVHQQLIAKRI